MRIPKAFFLIAILISFSCNSRQKEDTDSSWEASNLEPAYEELYYGPISGIIDTLSIVFLHLNCGEWGGDRQRIYFTRNEEKRLEARLIADTISCDNIIENDEISFLDDDKRVVIKDTVKLISKDEEQQISELLSNQFAKFLVGTDDSPISHYVEIKDTYGSIHLEGWGYEIYDLLKLSQMLFGNVYPKGRVVTSYTVRIE